MTYRMRSDRSTHTLCVLRQTELIPHYVFCVSLYRPILAIRNVESVGKHAGFTHLRP